MKLSRTILHIVALTAVLGVGAELWAGDIAINSGTGVYNTGFSGGAVIADGATDPHYTGTGPAAEFAVTSAGGFPVGPWLADDTLSTWISLGGHGDEATGDIDNFMSFTSPTTGTVTLTGQWSTDNSGTKILVNGTTTVATAAGFDTWYPFSITAPVHVGVNTLDFVQNNAGGPGGVRVEFFTANVVPEPGSMVLGGLGALGLLIAVRRRRNA